MHSVRDSRSKKEDRKKAAAAHRFLGPRVEEAQGEAMRPLIWEAQREAEKRAAAERANRE